MPIAVERHLETFADAVLNDHFEAMVAADVEDEMALSVGLVAVLKRRVETMEANGIVFGADDVDTGKRVINRMLAAMPKIRRAARAVGEAGHPVPVETVEGFDAAMLDLRECLGFLEDPTPWTAANVSAAEFTGPRPGPTQAWYDEDMTALAGPLGE